MTAAFVVLATGVIISGCKVAGGESVSVMGELQQVKA